MTKSIRISDEAYERLMKMKREGESFSGALLREIEKYEKKQQNRLISED